MSDLKYIKDNSDSQDDVKKVSIEAPDNKPVHLEVSGDLTVKGKINVGQTWYEVLPQGIIMLWHGDDKNVPEGWAICDGNSGTPDLRGRFVMGKKDEANQGTKVVMGGSPSMIKKKNISGSGLDMSKAEYVSEIDYPPFMALYYIMKL